MVYLLQEILLRLFILLLTAVGYAGAQSGTRGPDVGAAIPQFSAADQNGVTRTLDQVKGPKGTMVVFYRSADW